MTEVPPLRREVIVEASPDVAFRVFTDRIGAWWPLAAHSVFGDGTVEFVHGTIVETSASGERDVWGTVTDWDPPNHLAMTWHPGSTPDRATAVEVSFFAVGDHTLVTLVHRGWEVYADPQAASDEYEMGWPAVLAGFVTEVGAA